MNGIVLDFERPVAELEKKIAELERFSQEKKIDLSQEIKRLQEKLDTLKKEIFGNLSPWQRVQIARHPKRPYTLDYIAMLGTDFIEIHGDRAFADDKAIIGGFLKIENQKWLVVGHQKGRDTKENLFRNFGSAHPEGYRKALRLFQMAEKFELPILIFIDTPGAYPGIGAEERGQAHSIAFNLREMTNIRTPIVIVVIGEGGSGGALGIGIGDKVCMLENSYYSVISPEGCAAILWRSHTKAPDAAEALKLTGQDLIKLGIIEEIIEEPLGGAHRDPACAAKGIKNAAMKYYKELKALKIDELLENRYARFRKIGSFLEKGTKTT